MPRAGLPRSLWLVSRAWTGHGQGKHSEAFSEIQRVFLPSLGGQVLAAEAVLGP